MPDTDLLLRIKPQANGVYPVEAIVDGGDGGHYTGGELRVAVSEFVPLALDSEKYGKKLFEGLFAGEIRRAYDKAVAKAEADPASHLRVRVWIDANAPELHTLNWERLYHQYRGQVAPLAVSAGTPLSRYTPLETPIPPAVVERPIRLFISVANPSDLPPDLKPARVEEEIETLRQAVSGNANWQVSLLAGRTGLPQAVKDKLQAEGWELLEGATTLTNIARGVQDAHVWHFIGHGSFNRQTRNGLLHLEKDDGTRQAAPDVDVVQKLSGARHLRLIFMVACQSAERPADIEHPFIGVAPKLVQSGVPAIIAMQDFVPMEFARLLTGDFYQRLAAHGKVDEALSEARSTLFGRKSAAWAIPVLFMRLRGGQLFATSAAESETNTRTEQAAMTQIMNTVNNTINQTGNNNVAVQGNNNTVVNQSNSGGVNFGSVGGSINIGGDVVGGDKIVTNTGGGNEGGQDPYFFLKTKFKKINKAIDALSADEDTKDDLKKYVSRVLDEVLKGDAADTARLMKNFGNLKDDAPEIAQAILNAFNEPMVTVSNTVRDALA